MIIFESTNTDKYSDSSFTVLSNLHWHIPTGKFKNSVKSSEYKVWIYLMPAIHKNDILMLTMAVTRPYHSLVNSGL